MHDAGTISRTGDIFKLPLVLRIESIVFSFVKVSLAIIISDKNNKKITMNGDINIIEIINSFLIPKIFKKSPQSIKQCCYTSDYSWILLYKNVIVFLKNWNNYFFLRLFSSNQIIDGMPI